MRIVALLLSLIVVAGCDPEKPPKPTPRGNTPPATRQTPAPPVVQKSLLKVKLEREGHVLEGGKWYKNEKWSWTINNLWELDEAPGKCDNVVLRKYWDHVTERSIVGAGPGFPTEITEIRQEWGPEKLMFLAPPPPGKGTVTLSVELPADLVECKVRAPGEIHWKDKKGIIKVTAVAGKDRRELYTIEEGRNDDNHDVTDLVKGKRMLEILAEIEEMTCTHTENKPARTFEAHARFLPSVKDRTRKVLEVTGVRRIPKPDVDARWKEAR